MSANKVTYFIIIIFSLIISCDANRYFDAYTEVPDQTWSRENKIKYEVEIIDTTVAYNVYLNVRNSGNYNYSNLFIFLKSVSPSGIARIDTIECTLCDERGKWFGKGIGDLWDMQKLLRKNVIFSEKGKYLFEIEQAMRDKNLKNISDIGLRIEFYSN